MSEWVVDENGKRVRNRLIDALYFSDWKTITQICEADPNAILRDTVDISIIINEYDGESRSATPLNFAASWCPPKMLLYMCRMICKHHLDIDWCNGDAYYTALSVACVCSDNVKKAMVLIEYGAQSFNAPTWTQNYDKALQVYELAKSNVLIKWEEMCRAACLVLMMRKQKSSCFHLVGHDMTRLIAQEVWEGRR